MSDRALHPTSSEKCCTDLSFDDVDIPPIHGSRLSHLAVQLQPQINNTIQYIVKDRSNAHFGDVLHIHLYQNTQATGTPRLRDLIPSTFPQELEAPRARHFHHDEPNRVEAWVQDVHDAELPPTASAVGHSGTSAWSNATAAGSAPTSRVPTPTQSLTDISYIGSAQNPLFRRGVIDPNATSKNQPRYQGMTARSMSAMDMHGIYRNSTLALGSNIDCIHVMEDDNIGVPDAWNNLPVQTEQDPKTDVSAIVDRLSHRACQSYGLYSRTLVHYIRVAVLTRHELEDMKAASAFSAKVAKSKAENGHRSFVSRALQNLNQKPKSQLEHLEKRLADVIIELGNLSGFFPQSESEHLRQLVRMVMNLLNEIQYLRRWGQPCETGALSFSVVQRQEKGTPRHQNHCGDCSDLDALHLYDQQTQEDPGGDDRACVRKLNDHTEKFSQLSILSNGKDLRSRCSIDESADSYEFIRFTDSISITLSSISHTTDYSSSETEGLFTNISLLAQLQDTERPYLLDCTKSRCKVIAKYTLQNFECSLDQHKLEPGAIINTKWEVPRDCKLLDRARSRSSSVEEIDLVILTATPDQCWCLPILESPPSPWQSWKAYAEQSRVEYHSIGFLDHSHLNTEAPAVRNSRHRNWDLLFPRINLTTVPVQLTRKHRFHCLGIVHQSILPKLLQCTREALKRAYEDLVFATPDS